MVHVAQMIQTNTAAPGAGLPGADAKPAAAPEFRRLVEAVLAQCPAQQEQQPADAAQDGVEAAPATLPQGVAADALPEGKGDTGAELAVLEEKDPQDAQAPELNTQCAAAAAMMAQTQFSGNAADGDNGETQGVSAAAELATGYSGPVPTVGRAAQAHGAQLATQAQDTAYGQAQDTAYGQAQDTAYSQALGTAEGQGMQQATAGTDQVGPSVFAQTETVPLTQATLPFNEAGGAAAAGEELPWTGGGARAEAEADAQQDGGVAAAPRATGSLAAGERLMRAIRQAASGKDGADNARADGDAGNALPRTQDAAGAVMSLEALPAQGGEEPDVPGRAQNVPESIYRLVEGIAQSEAGGAKEFEVSLKPEFMGDMSIKLVAEEDGLRAIIKVAERPASELIAGELTSLRELLRDKGINIAHLEVAYQPPRASDAERQAARQQGGGSWESRKGHGKTASQAVELGAALDPAAEQRTRLNGSVEFSA